MGASPKQVQVPGPEQLEVLENVIADTSTPAVTRRSILGRAAVGVASVGALAVLDPAAALAQTLHHPDSIKTIGTTAVTAEAFAVTYLTRLLDKAPSSVPASVATILKAADAAEEDHYRFLKGAGFRPLTTKFWIPDNFFDYSDLKHIASVIETAETLFINAYLIAVTSFALARQPDLARYAGEILGVEAEHRTLARYLQGDTRPSNPPNNVGFEAFTYQHEGSIVKALESVGIGFGTKGSAAGAFYSYHGTGNLGVHLAHNTPDSVKTPVPRSSRSAGHRARRSGPRFTG